MEPDKLMVPRGDNVEFLCETATEAKWFFNHGPLPANADETGNSLLITNIKRRNHGIYECLGVANNPPYYSYISSTILVHSKSEKMHSAC